MAVFSLLSARSAKKSSKAQQQANEAQRKANRLQNKQSKRQFLRTVRQAAASNIINSVSAGVGVESSAFQGTAASERSQAQTALREFDQADALGAQFTAAQNSVSKYNYRAQAFGQAASFVNSFVSFGSGGVKWRS